jgi:hypothetical protein
MRSPMGRPGQGRLSAQALRLGSLGLVSWLCGRFAEAADYQTQALALNRALGERGNEGIDLANLGECQAAAVRPEPPATISKGRRRRRFHWPGLGKDSKTQAGGGAAARGRRGYSRFVSGHSDGRFRSYPANLHRLAAHVAGRLGPAPASNTAGSSNDPLPQRPPHERRPGRHEHFAHTIINHAW